MAPRIRTTAPNALSGADSRSAHHPAASEDMGFAFQQDANGKIWYTLVVGGGPVLSVLSPAPRANTAPPAPAPTVPVPTTETPGV